MNEAECCPFFQIVRKDGQTMTGDFGVLQEIV